MLNNGTDKCSCPNADCKRNGKCEECLIFHGEGNSLTRCQRDAKQRETANKEDQA